MTDLALEVSHHYNHPPERVFDAWLDPAMLAKFMAPGPTMSVPEATSDARVGGRFRIVMHGEEAGDLSHEGEYLEIDRPNRLVFTWVSAFTLPDSTVTLDFAARDGGTEVTLTHIRFPSEESRDNHQGGWAAILAKLDAAL